jgi:hypothetical protein
MNRRQWKKKYFICYDDDKRPIYAGDSVEVMIPYETSTPHQSRVYWNPLDGALIKRHPAHLTLSPDRGKYRSLRSYLNQSKKGVPIWGHPDDTEPKEYRKGYCKKIKSFYEQ